MRTRSKPTPKGGAAPTRSADAPKTITLPPADAEPLKVLVLPKNTSDDARVVTLKDPVTASSKRYFVCPDKGFYEFTKIAASRQTPRSWLIGGSVEDGSQGKADTAVKSQEEGEEDGQGDGYLAKEPDLLIATPVDPALLLLPALAPSKRDGKQMFLALDDHLEAWEATSPHAKSIVSNHRIRRRIEDSLAAVCEVVDAGDEKMYRLSQDKLLATLVSRARRACKGGLPGSMEEHFVREGLKAPFISSAPSGDTSNDSVKESQTSVDSGYSSASAGSQDITALESDTGLQSQVQLAPSDEICQLKRLRTALDFVLSSYLPPHLQTAMRALLATTKSVDFRPLDDYQARLEKLKEQSRALATLSENISRKRAAEDDDEAAEMRAEKKRRKEAEEAKKKAETKALKDLKKADVSGMKKLSTFFAKKPAK